MDVAIAGGHGQIAMHLGRMLAARGDRVRGLVRNPDQAPDLEAIGVEPVVCDLEADCDVAAAIEGADAVVFAAGAGPGSGAERKATMDRDGAVKLIEAAKAAGVRRYVMISAMGAADPPAGDEVFAVYLQAKADADRALAESGLDYTIVRPGRLTNDPGTGRVRAGESVGRGEVSREDVAAAIVHVLDSPSTIGATFELVGGPTPIREALAAVG